jgi:hypothetical protein
MTAVRLDYAAIAALNESDGLVGRAVQRAADVTAERIRTLIRGYGLVDTGAMLGDVQALPAVADADKVTIRVGTPNVEYALYQRDHFLTEALADVTVNDYQE